MATSSPVSGRCGASALPGRREQSIEAAEETGVWPVRRRRGLRTRIDVLKSIEVALKSIFASRPEMALLRAPRASEVKTDGGSSPRNFLESPMNSSPMLCDALFGICLSGTET